MNLHSARFARESTFISVVVFSFSFLSLLAVVRFGPAVERTPTD
jgi:hypothetical protein